MIDAVHAAAHQAVMAWLDRRGFGRVRAEVCAGASGSVLEIGAGTGRNMRHLDQAAKLVAIEPDGRVHRRLSRAASHRGGAVTILAASGEEIPLADESVDAVVMTLVLCSVASPEAVLAEIRRVLRPGGALRFAEHVRDTDPRRAERQDRYADAWRRCAGGCRPNRDTLAALEAAGFVIDHVEHGELAGAPRLVRPLIVGAARPG